MKLEWLEWLILYERYGSLQQVSKICHGTSQNIGKMLDNLETEMGITLFNRNGKSRKLTTAGLELVEIAEKTINSIEALKDKYNEQGHNISGNLKVISTDSQIIQSLLNSFLQRYPDVKISYMDLSFEEALEYTKENKDILAFVPIWQNESFYQMLKKYEPYCNIHMLFQEKQKILVSNDSELLKLKEVTFKDLNDYPIITYIRSGEPGDAKEIFYKLLYDGSETNLKITGTNSKSYFEKMIKNNLAVGMGLYSTFSYMEELGNISSLNLKEKELQVCVWSLVYNVDKKMNACDKVFINALEQYCVQLRKKNN